MGLRPPSALLKPRIVESGLWNQDHVDQSYDPSFLAVLQKLASRLLELAMTGDTARLRKLYAPGWKRWTPVEAVDTKSGAVSEKAGNGALEILPPKKLAPELAPLSLRCA